MMLCAAGQVRVASQSIKRSRCDGYDGRRFAKRSQSGNRVRLGTAGDIGELAGDIFRRFLRSANRLFHCVTDYIP